MPYVFNPFTGTLDYTAPAAAPDLTDAEAFAFFMGG